MSLRIAGALRASRGGPRIVMSPSQVAPFAASSLPRTMELAELVAPLLEKHLPPSSDWPFHDRVFAWLAPHFQNKISDFHERRGAGLTQQHGDSLLERLDAELFAALVRRVDSLLAREIARLRAARKGSRA